MKSFLLLLFIYSCTSFKSIFPSGQDYSQDFRENSSSRWTKNHSLNLLVLVDPSLNNQTFVNEMTKIWQIFLKRYHSRLAFSYLDNSFQDYYLQTNTQNIAPLFSNSLHKDPINVSTLPVLEQHRVSGLLYTQEKLTYLLEQKFFLTQNDTFIFIVTEKDDIEFTKALNGQDLIDNWKNRVSQLKKLKNQNFGQIKNLDKLRILTAVPHKSCGKLKTASKYINSSQEIKEFYLKKSFQIKDGHQDSIDLCQSSEQKIANFLYQEIIKHFNESQLPRTLEN